jgi:hypothetical protein
MCLANSLFIKQIARFRSADRRRTALALSTKQHTLGTAGVGYQPPDGDPVLKRTDERHRVHRIDVEHRELVRRAGSGAQAIEASS